MIRLEYRWIIYSNIITKQDLSSLLKGDVNVALINSKKNIQQAFVIRVIFILIKSLKNEQFINPFIYLLRSEITFKYFFLFFFLDLYK